MHAQTTRTQENVIENLYSPLMIIFLHQLYW